MDNGAHLRALDAQISKLREEIHQATSSTVAGGLDRCGNDVLDEKREIAINSAGLSEDDTHQSEKPVGLKSYEELIQNNTQATPRPRSSTEEGGGEVNDESHRRGGEMLHDSTSMSDAEKILAGVVGQTTTATKPKTTNDRDPNTIDRYHGTHHNAGSPPSDLCARPIVGLPPLSPRFRGVVLRSDSPPPNPIEEEACTSESNYARYLYARGGSDQDDDDAHKDCDDGALVDEWGSSLGVGGGIETARVLRRIQLSSSPTFSGEGIGVGVEEAPTTSMRDVANMHNTFTRILSDRHFLDRAHFSGSPLPADADDYDDDQSFTGNNRRVCSSSSPLRRSSDYDLHQHNQHPTNSRSTSHLDRSGSELNNNNAEHSVPSSSGGHSANLNKNEYLNNEDDEDMAEPDAFDEGSPLHSSPPRRRKRKGSSSSSLLLSKPGDDGSSPKIGGVDGLSSSTPFHQQALPSNTCSNLPEGIDHYTAINVPAGGGGGTVRDNPSGKRAIQPLLTQTLPQQAQAPQTQTPKQHLRNASKRETPRDRALSGASVFSYSSGIVYEAGEIDMEEILRQDQGATDVEGAAASRNITADSVSSPSPCGHHQKPTFSHSPVPEAEAQVNQPSQDVPSDEDHKRVNPFRNAPQITSSAFSSPLHFYEDGPSARTTYAEAMERFAASISVVSMLYETVLSDKYELFMGSQRVALVSEIRGLRAAMKALEGDRAALLKSIQTAGVESAFKLREAEEGAKAMERRALEAEEALNGTKAELSQARARQEELAADLFNAKAKVEHNDLRVSVTTEEPIIRHRRGGGESNNENENTSTDNAIAMFVVSPLTPAAPLRQGGQDEDKSQVNKSSNGTNKDDNVAVSFGDASISESRPRDGSGRSASYMYSDTSSFGAVSSVSRSRPSASGVRDVGEEEEEGIDGDDDVHNNLRSATVLDATARPSSQSLSALSAMSVSVSRGHSTATATKSPSISPARHNHQHHDHLGLSEEPHLLLLPSSQEDTTSKSNNTKNNNTTTNSKSVSGVTDSTTGNNLVPSTSTSIYVPPSGRYGKVVQSNHNECNPPSVLGKTDTKTNAAKEENYCGTVIEDGGEEVEGEERSCTRFSIPPPPRLATVSSIPVASSSYSVSIARYSVSASVPPTAPPSMEDEAMAMPTTATSALRRSSTVLRAVSSDDLTADRDCDHEEPPAVRPSVTFALPALPDKIVEHFSAHTANANEDKDDLPPREVDTVVCAMTNNRDNSEGKRQKEASQPEPQSSSVSVLRRSSSFSHDSPAPTNASSSACRRNSGSAASYVPSSSAVKNWPGNTSRSASSSTNSAAATKPSRPVSDFSNKGISGGERTCASVSHSSSILSSQSGKAPDGRPSHAGLKVRDDKGQISGDPHVDLGYGSSPVLIESDPLRLREDKALLDSFVASVANALALSGQKPKEQTTATSLVSHLETNFNDKLRLARSDIIALREEKTAALSENRKQRLIAQRLKERVVGLEKDLEVLQKKYEGKLVELSTVSKQHARALSGQSQALQKGKEKEKERAVLDEQREKSIEASMKTLSESLVSCEAVERGIITDLEDTSRHFAADMRSNTLTAATMALREKQERERHSVREGVRLESKHQERVDAIVATAKRDAEALLARVKDLERESDRLRGVAKTTGDKYLAALAEVETAHTELSVLSQQLGDAQAENERMSMLLVAAAEANKKSQQSSPQQVSLCEVGVDCRLPYPEQTSENTNHDNSSSNKKQDKEPASNPRRLEEELDKLKTQMEPLQAEVMSARRREAAILKAASTDHTPSEAAESMLKALTGENERLVAIIRALQKKEKEKEIKEKEAAEREREKDTKANLSPVEAQSKSQPTLQSTSSAVREVQQGPTTTVPQQNNPPQIIETRPSKPLSPIPTLQDLAEDESSAAAALTLTDAVASSSHKQVRPGVGVENVFEEQQRKKSQGTTNLANATDTAAPPHSGNHFLDAHSRKPRNTHEDGSRQPSPADSTTETLDFARKRLSVLEDALLRSVAEASRLQEELEEDEDRSQKPEEWNNGACEVSVNEMYNAFDRQRQRRAEEWDGQRGRSLSNRRTPIRTAHTPRRRGHAAEHAPSGRSFTFAEAADRFSTTSASFEASVRPEELADFRDSYAFPENESSGDGVGAPPPTSRPRTPRQPFSRRASAVLMDSHTYSQQGGGGGAEEDSSHISTRNQSSLHRATPTRSLPPPPQTPAELGLQVEMRRWHEVVIKTGERLFPQTNASVRRGVRVSADMYENIDTFEGPTSATGADRSFGFGSHPMGGDEGETSRDRATPTASFRRDNSNSNLHYSSHTPTYVESMSLIRQRAVRR